MILRDILDAPAGHLKQHEAGGRALVPVEGAELALVHLGGGLVVRHEDEAAQVRPLVDDLLEAAHHPAGEAAALKLLDDEDVGEVGEGDVVGDDAGEADELDVGSVWAFRGTVFYLIWEKSAWPILRGIVGCQVWPEKARMPCQLQRTAKRKERKGEW